MFRQSSLGRLETGIADGPLISIKVFESRDEEFRLLNRLVQPRNVSHELRRMSGQRAPISFLFIIPHYAICSLSSEPRGML